MDSEFTHEDAIEILDTLERFLYHAGETEDLEELALVDEVAAEVREIRGRLKSVESI